MNRLAWRLCVIVVVLLVFGALGIYPILAPQFGIHSPAWLMNEQLKLGLDLQGGAQLVLQVDTDTALRLDTEQAMARVRDEALTRRITSTFTIIDSTHFRVDGVSSEQEALLREAAAETHADFDINPGPDGRYVFAMKPSVQAARRSDAVTQARQTIERRVNELGVTEPSIAQQGANGDQILVQLPGVADVERARDIIKVGGFLEWKIVEQGSVATRQALLVNGSVPTDMELLPNARGVLHEPAATQYYLVRKLATVTGRDLRNARPTVDENNQPAVSFTLTVEGGRKFGTLTGENIGRQLAIVLDGAVQSSARIEGRITTDGRLFGSFTPEDVQNLSLILRSGALPAPLAVIQEQKIGASLGADSVRAGLTASVVGLFLVVAFMLTYYRLSGVNAVVALVLNLVILLGLMAYIGAVMTLPGIAGFVLTIGLGVDSNVLIFERIKEELEAKRGLRMAIQTGFGRVFLTLLDTHVAALISAGFLFQFGTGPIRGFAVTLFVGLLSNLFTSTFVSKTLFEVVLARRQEGKTLSI